MMPGMRGMNPKMLQQMMKQLGITVEEHDDVTRVVIETPTKDYVFTKPQVSAMKAQGQTTWQVQGEPKVVPKGGGPSVKEGLVPRHPAETAPGIAISPRPGAEAEPKPLYSEEDVKLVMQGAGVTREKARKALDDAEGEVATAILGLTEGA